MGVDPFSASCTSANNLEGYHFFSVKHVICFADEANLQYSTEPKDAPAATQDHSPEIGMHLRRKSFRFAGFATEASFCILHLLQRLFEGL